MRLPSKVTPFRKSILSTYPDVLRILQKGDIGPIELYRELKPREIDILDYIEILDGLYLLGQVSFSSGKEILHYVEKDPM